MGPASPNASSSSAAGPEADAVREAAGGACVSPSSPKRSAPAHAVECRARGGGDAEFVLIMNGDVPLVLPETLARLMGAVESSPSADLALLTA